VMRWPRLMSAVATTTFAVDDDVCEIIQREPKTTAARPAAVASSSMNIARELFMSVSPTYAGSAALPVI
jgi:hypothetical protein